MQFRQELHDCTSYSESQSNGRLKRITSNRKLLSPLQRRANKPWTGASDMHVPVIKYSRNRLLAEIISSTFLTHPIFNVEGVTVADEEFAKSVEEFLDRLFTDVMSLEEAMDPIIQDALDDGVGIVYNAWKRDIKRLPRWVPTPVMAEVIGESGTVETVETGATEFVQTDEPRVVYDGPDVQRIPIERFGIYPPTAKDIQSALGCWAKLTYSGSELLQGVENGEFDAAMVEQLKSWQGDQEALEDAEATRREIGDGSVSTVDFRNRHYQIYLCYWRLPTERGRPSIEWVVWEHMPTMTIIRSEPNPYWHQMRPFLALRPFPDKSGIHGDSLPDLIGDMQQTMTAIVRQVIDQATIDIHPPVIVNENLVPPDTIDKLKFAPGQVWRVHQMDAIHIPYRPSQVSVGLEVNEMVRQVVARCVGIDDNTLGMMAQPSATATQTQAVQSNAGALFSLVVNRIRRGLNLLAKQTISNCYQYVGNEGVLGLWYKLVGQGEPNPFDVAQQAIDAFGAQYHFSAAGSTEVSNKELKKALAREVYERLVINPIMTANPLRIFALTRWYLTEMGVRIPEELIGKEQEIKDALAEQAKAQVDAMSAEEREQAKLADQQATAQQMDEAPMVVDDLLQAMMGGPDGGEAGGAELAGSAGSSGVQAGVALS